MNVIIGMHGDLKRHFLKECVLTSSAYEADVSGCFFLQTKAINQIHFVIAMTLLNRFMANRVGKTIHNLCHGDF